MTQRERFERIYQHYHPYVHAYATRRVAAPVVDDVVAECFLVAWRRFEEIPDDGLPWLYRTAANVIRTSYRSAQRWASLQDRLAAQPRAKDTDLADVLVMRDNLARALAHLSETDRELVLLSDWDGMSNTDIAQVLDVQPGAVGVRLHRARARLRDHLTQQREAEEAR